MVILFYASRCISQYVFLICFTTLEFLHDLAFTHDVCEWFAWSPYVRWDARCNELDETGAWFDLLTDCLGFRFFVVYENSFMRIDGSKYESDLNLAFAIYLRALGSSTMLEAAKF